MQRAGAKAGRQFSALVRFFEVPDEKAQFLLSERGVLSRRCGDHRDR